MTRDQQIAAQTGWELPLVKRLRHNKDVRRRLNLWLADPRCHWCSCVTDFAPGQERHFPTKATTDHLKSRLMGRAPGEVVPVVLACHQCNQQRNVVETKQLRPTGKTVLDTQGQMCLTLRT